MKVCHLYPIPPFQIIPGEKQMTGIIKAAVDL
jgi:hypothetical protein